MSPPVPGPATGDPPLAFDIAFLRARAAACALTVTDLAHLTGLPATDLDRHLRPDALSATRLLHLARALDTPPEALLLAPTRTRAPAPDRPGTDDATRLHAALHTAGRIHPADLATVLGWPPERLHTAARTLDQRLHHPHSPERLLHTDALIHLTTAPGLLTAQQRTQLETAGHQSTTLTPDEAALAARLLHHHREGTLAPTLRPADLPRLAERRFLAPDDPAAPHPDLLFALGVTATPTAPPRKDPA